MATSHRIEKINRTIRDVVADVIQNHLNDPRLVGLISVTRVDTTGDLKQSKIYLSILGATDAQATMAMRAIVHAGGRIQSYVARALSTRLCPSLSYHLDDSLKKAYEISQLIDQAIGERREQCPVDEPAAEDDDEE